MRYLIETGTLRGFLQFITLPESGDTMAYPMAAQFRGGRSLLQRLSQLLTKADERLKWVDKHFHDDDVARQAFESGEVLAEPGEPLLVLTMQRRHVTVLAGSTVLVKEVASLPALRKAVDSALKSLKD